MSHPTDAQMNDDDGVSDRPTAADSVMEHVAYHVQFIGGQVDGGFWGSITNLACVLFFFVIRLQIDIVSVERK